VVSTTGEPTSEAGFFLTNEQVDQLEVKNTMVGHANLYRAGMLSVVICSSCQKRIREGADLKETVESEDRRLLNEILDKLGCSRGDAEGPFGALQELDRLLDLAGDAHG
jgi:hypothetical protein